MMPYPNSFRANPSAYLIYPPDDPRSVHLRAIDSLFLAFSNTVHDGASPTRGTASKLEITVHEKEGTLRVFDDGVGLSVEDDSIELCFTDLERCAELRRTSLAILNAFCAELTYETAQKGGVWRYHSKQGYSEAGCQRVEDSSEQWQTLTIMPDRKIFSHGLTVVGFTEMLQKGLFGEPPFEEPFRYAVENVPVTVIDAASGHRHQMITVTAT